MPVTVTVCVANAVGVSPVGVELGEVVNVVMTVAAIVGVGKDCIVSTTRVPASASAVDRMSGVDEGVEIIFV